MISRTENFYAQCDSVDQHQDARSLWEGKKINVYCAGCEGSGHCNVKFKEEEWPTHGKAYKYLQKNMYDRSNDQNPFKAKQKMCNPENSKKHDSKMHLFSEVRGMGFLRDRW